MSRSLYVLATFLLVCATMAAPAPDPFAGGWGDPVDPDKDCKIRRNEGVLTIEMPGAVHDYDTLHKRLNAPRLFREVDGNFEIQMRVRIDCVPSAHSTVKDQPSCVSGGFLLIYPEFCRCICERFEYGISQKGIGLDGYAVEPNLSGRHIENKSRNDIGEEGYASLKGWYGKKGKIAMTWDRESQSLHHMLWDRGDAGWPLLSMPKQTNHAYLRLDLRWEQQNAWLYFFISPDGENWRELVKSSAPFTHLKLGLAAYSTSSDPSKVRFDKLKFTRGK